MLSLLPPSGAREFFGQNVSNQTGGARLEPIGWQRADGVKYVGIDLIRVDPTSTDFFSLLQHVVDTVQVSIGRPRLDIFSALSCVLSLHDDQQALLKAAMSAWVFGGMGSWNDMGFQGKTQAEYEQVSEDLFVIVTDAIQVAANSTSPEEKARSLITTA